MTPQFYVDILVELRLCHIPTKRMFVLFLNSARCHFLDTPFLTQNLRCLSCNRPTLPTYDWRRDESRLQLHRSCSFMIHAGSPNHEWFHVLKQKLTITPQIHWSNFNAIKLTSLLAGSAAKDYPCSWVAMTVRRRFPTNSMYIDIEREALFTRLSILELNYTTPPHSIHRTDIQ